VSGWKPCPANHTSKPALPPSGQPMASEAGKVLSVLSVLSGRGTSLAAEAARPQPRHGDPRPPGAAKLQAATGFRHIPGGDPLAARRKAAAGLGDAPRWWRALAKREGMAARALQFLALCASNPDHVRGMTWAETDSGCRDKTDKTDRTPRATCATTAT